MRGTLKRSAAVIVGLLVVAWAVLPMAVAAAATKNNVTNGDEAWFQRFQEPLAEAPSGDPTCDLPTGCNAAGNATRRSVGHPEGTLVVAANGGEPDAQVFFNFALDKLPLGAVVTGGTVTMPVATDDESGNVRPDAAKLVACLVTGFIPGGAEGGSYKDRPEFDDGTCVPVEQDDKAKTLTYTFDLKRFGKAWGSGAQPMQGVTILKDPEVKSPAPQETWRVVFNTARRAAEDPEKFPPITSDLQFTVKAAGLGPVVVPETGGDLGGGGFDTGGGFDSGGSFDSGTTGGSFDTGGTTAGSFDSGATSGSFDSGAAPSTGSISPPQSAEAPAVTEPEPAADPAQQPIAAPAPVPAAATGVSPAVWILPLLAVAMAGALAWSLLQPVELVGEREGAVSKLMRNRRLAGSDPTSPV